MPSGSDKNDLLNAAIGGIYQYTLDKAAMPAALRHVQALFDSPAVALWTTNPTSGDILQFDYLGYSEESIQQYQDYYFGIDPGLTDVLSARVGQWTPFHALHLLHSGQAFAPETAEFIHDFCLKRDIRWLAGGKIIEDPETFTYLSLRRSPGQENFSATDVRCFEALAPHWRRAIQIENRMGLLGVSADLAEAAMDRMVAGMIVVDSGLKIHYANRAAGELLGKQKEFTSLHGVLTSRSPVIRERITAAVARALTGVHLGLEIPNEDAFATLRAQALALPHHASSRFGSGQALVLIVLHRASDGVAPVEVLRGAFGLSPAIARLVAGLSDGETLEDIAARTGTAIATLRSQLAHAFTRVGVRTQAQLVALVRSLPGVRR